MESKSHSTRKTTSPNKQHILLLTGVPGIGKTTLIRKVAAQIQQYRIGGFYTEEIRQSGQREGFRLITFNSDQGIIAHVNFDHRYRVGKYGVDVATIDRFSDVALTVEQEIDIYLIDEIGKMECLAPHFIARVEALLNSDKTLIATVGKKGGGLIEKVKHWPGSRLYEITRANRDAVLSQVMAWLHEQAECQ